MHFSKIFSKIVLALGVTFLLIGFLNFVFDSLSVQAKNYGNKLPNMGGSANASILESGEIVATPLGSAGSDRLFINSIGVNTELAGATLKNISNLDKLLLFTPVVETETAGSLCSLNENAYIYGHSEPANSSQAGYPAVHIFQNLHTVTEGELINIGLANGSACTYKVVGFEKVVTLADGVGVSTEDFNRAMYPEMGKNGSLTIQTCVLGSRTERLLLRAELIKPSNNSAAVDL